MKELHLVLLLTTIFFCFIQINSSSNYTSYAQEQSLQSRDNQAQHTSPSIEPALSVKITSPSNGQNVSAGQLTISGTSSDTNIRECEVYADWNDRKPFQRVAAAGSEGNGDYSRWNYTYTTDYHEIVNGTNELTSKISCLASPTNLTKWYSINVTGIEGLISSLNDSSKSSNLDQANNIPNLNNDSSPISTISTAEITAPRHGSYAGSEGSERNSDNNNYDVDDNRREDRDEGNEEQDEENDFVIEDNQDNEDANNENTELISNENNREEDEEDVTSDDNRREDRDEGNEEQDEENDFVIEDNQDNEDANNENTELISNENNREEDEEDVTPENDFDDSDQSENESQESPSEDTDSIEADLEAFRDKGKYVDKDRLGSEESDIHSPFDVPFEVPLLTIPSVPSLPIPDLEDPLQSEEDNCDIDDAGFPFCNDQQLGERPIDYNDNCDIDDAGFPFCEG